jgi:cbb3-type cytochrome oxidase subunit 1
MMQLVLGVILFFLPSIAAEGRAQSDSHPLLYLAMNLGTTGVLFGFATGKVLFAGAAGFLVLGALLVVGPEALRLGGVAGQFGALHRWNYRLALLAMLAGFLLGECLALGLVPEQYGLIRLMHIQSLLIGGLTLGVVAAVHTLLPVLLQRELYSARLATVTFLLFPIGILVVLVGFCLSSVSVQLAGGTVLIVAGSLLVYNLFRTWFEAGQLDRAASDHLLVSMFFLLLAAITGALVSANYLSGQPKVPYGTLHLVAYTHAALIGCFVHLVFGSLSYLLPTSLAQTRVHNHKKRSAYLAALEDIMNRWRWAQVGALSMGTLGLAMVAALAWQVPLGSAALQMTSWLTCGLLLVGLTLFAFKVSRACITHPSE